MQDTVCSPRLSHYPSLFVRGTRYKILTCLNIYLRWHATNYDYMILGHILNIY